MKDLIACLYSEGYTFSQLKELEKQMILPDCKGSFFDYCNKYNIKYLVGNEIFLKKAKSLPYVLYYQGDINLIDKKIIGIVGPRKMTPFIKIALEKFFKFLEGKNIVVVSGFASGTDQYAHKLALKYNILTIAVLGFGFKKAMESVDRMFLKEIVEKDGLLLSEFRLNQGGTNWTFPQRNRIIAGLSDFLFVPQAAENSGTLITVNDAIKIRIPVYSCFSSYSDELGMGTNKLIFENKIIGIYDFDLFLKQIGKKFGLEKIKGKIETKLLPEEEQVVKILKSGKNSLEEIVFKIGLSIPEVLNILSGLELKGIIYEQLGNYFIK